MGEFLYVLGNPSMPGLIKIGRTERSVAERVIELSSHTGVPTGFVIIKEYVVPDSFAAERAIHERLADCRVVDNREFFKIEAEDALEIIESILGSTKPKMRDFELEDELIAKAIPIVVKRGFARPQMLEEALSISYEDALFVINTLQGRGVIGQFNESKWSTPNGQSSQAQHHDDVASIPLIGNYQLPSLDFLRNPDLIVKPMESEEELMANARLMQQTLAQFDIDVALGDITRGPAVTRYELHPAPGVKLEDIATSSHNIGAALNAQRIDILAPVPGKSSVGVDVPNRVKIKVNMRDLLESEDWRNSRAKIPLALGKDIYGHPIVADLAEMPHLLIAGNSGSGKSVCINAIIVSMLYRFSPDQLRFVMIDPKVVELQQYNTLPHLVLPVVMDPKKMILALRWIVNEVQKRYEIFAQVGVRNIGSFNSRPGEKNVKHSGDFIIPEKLSFVIVIIEHAEVLLQLGAAEIEAALGYLIESGRATGVHCVFTMDADSLNSFAEHIRVNIPSRIAFRCSSRSSSRLILGSAGAEALSGMGDLRFLPHGSVESIRIQGPIVSDQELQSIVYFIGAQGRPYYSIGTQFVPQPKFEPNWVVCVCQNCTGRIEFDTQQLGDSQSVWVECPHCGEETNLRNPNIDSSEAH